VSVGLGFFLVKLPKSHSSGIPTAAASTEVCPDPWPVASSEWL